MDNTQIILTILIVVNIALFFYNRNIGKQLSLDRCKYKEEIKTLNGDISALCSGATGLGNHLVYVEQQNRRLYERQDQIELRDPAEREYHNAVKLIQDGADIDRLVSAGGMMRGEAELLMMLHGDNRVEKLHAASARI